MYVEYDQYLSEIKHYLHRLGIQFREVGGVFFLTKCLIHTFLILVLNKTVNRQYINIAYNEMKLINIVNMIIKPFSLWLLKYFKIRRQNDAI
jgi:hypothetical protein